MSEVILTVGLPASGKSTWARDYIKKNPKTKIVSKDHLRAMLDDGKWSGGNEKFVLKARDSLIRAALEGGFSVIVDDTNLSPKHEPHIKELVKDLGVQVITQDFTHVSVEECIKRDAGRSNYVGERVIRSMWAKYLQTSIKTPEWDNRLSTAVLVDIDGTLALAGDRNHYDRDFINDEPNQPIVNLVKVLKNQFKIIFVSGRKSTYYDDTSNWIVKHVFPEFDEEWMCPNCVTPWKCNGPHSVAPFDLYMREIPSQEGIKDVLVKEHIYENHIKGNYNVAWVIDDRPQVCRYWYSIGLPLLKVGDPDAEF